MTISAPFTRQSGVLLAMLLAAGALLAADALLAAGTAFAQEDSPRPLARPLTDSVPSGSATPGAINLSLSDALQRALKSNAAILGGTQQERMAAADHLEDVSSLMPKINGRLSSVQEQLNLAAFGFTGLPGIPQIVGPFALVEARATFSQPIVDLEKLHNLRESTETQKAVVYSNKNTRELVVLAVTDMYFRAVAESSRTTAVQAQVTRAQALLSRASDMRAAGVVPGIDVLRAQVELQSEQQRLLQARNDFERRKLDLARAIGLPLAQEFVLSDRLPDAPSTLGSVDDMIARSWANRADVKEAESRLKASEEAVKASRAEGLPTLHLDADYGAIGRRPNSAHGTYSISGSLRFPIFNSGSKSDTMKDQAEADSRRIELDSLRGRIEHEVRSAVLEVQTATEKLRVAQSSLQLVRQQLDQAQDRFSAGVASNLEVVQAQESLALADENVISNLYAFNVARVLLARSMGIAEQSIQEFYGGTAR